MGDHQGSGARGLICYTAAMTQIEHGMVSTGFEIPGYRVRKDLGIVRGIVVRSRSIVGTIGAGLQTLIGGDITLFSNLAEKTREDAYERMCAHALERGANAVIGMRYDATDMGAGLTEVLAYGTAVEVEPE